MVDWIVMKWLRNLIMRLRLKSDCYCKFFRSPKSVVCCSSFRLPLSTEQENIQMSRRESRDYESRRHRSRYDREPSPKRFRRDVKPVDEKDTRNSNLHSEGNAARDRKHHHRTKDTVPREPSPVPDSKIPDGSLNKESERKLDGNRGGTKHSSDASSLPRSRSSVQHHERGNAGQAGQSDGRNSTSERGWWRDSKDRQSNKSADNTTRRDGKSQTKGEDEGAWRHDGFFEMEAGDPVPPARKRPPFRENKMPVVSKNSEKIVDAKKLREPHQLEDKRGRGEERGRQSRRIDRVDEEGAEGKTATDRQAPRGAYPARDRYGGGGGGYYSGRDRSRHWTNQVQVEKWKHDLFEEANRSPAPKNEEDQIAKVEAMLAS